MPPSVEEMVFHGEQLYRRRFRPNQFPEYAVLDIRQRARRRRHGSHTRICYISQCNNVLFIKIQIASSPYRSFEGIYRRQHSILHEGGSTTFYSGNTTTRETTRKRKRSGNFGEDPLNGPRILAANRIINGMHLESSMLSEIERGKLKKPKVIYVHGASGSGKTYYALQRGICDYGKENVCTIRFDRSGFAHCSNPLAKCLVLMEFRPSCLDAVTFLELTDGYGIHLNIKHGSIYIRPRCIIICSILPPSEIYKEEINRQFTRRLTEIVNKDLDPFIDRTEESESEGSTIELASDSDF